MSTLRTLLRLGIFILLALSVVQGQVGASTPPPTVKKPIGNKPVVDKPANGSPEGNTPAGEAAKPDAAKPSLTRPLGNARLDAVASDYANLSFTGCGDYQPETHTLTCDGNGFQAKVNDGLKAQIKLFRVGDIIRVEINDKGELADLRGALSVPTEGISGYCRFLVLTACALAILGLAAALSKGSPLKFIVSVDNRYSNSQFQIALWFWVVLSTYIAVVVFRVLYAGWDFFGAVSIPQNLLVLSGLSAITYGGAKAITTSKVNAAMNPAPVAVAVAPAPAPAPVAVAVVPGATPVPAAVVVTHAPTTAPAAVAVAPAPNPDPKRAQPPGHENIFKDLVQNDFGDVDFGDFQMLVVTLVAVGMYMTLIYHFLGTIEFLKTATLPDVDTTILAGFGLGQGAYLAKKAGGDVGKS